MQQLLKQRNKIVGLLLGSFAILCLAAVLWQQMKASPRHKGTVVISVDGIEQRLPITLDLQREIKTETGYNQLEIKDGKVRMTEASCPDHICVKTGEICCAHQTIACLPNKVLIYIEEK